MAWKSTKISLKNVNGVCDSSKCFICNELSIILLNKNIAHSPQWTSDYTGCIFKHSLQKYTVEYYRHKGDYFSLHPVIFVLISLFFIFFWHVLIVFWRQSFCTIIIGSPLEAAPT